MKKTFSRIKSLLTGLIVFLFPLFFLTATQEFFVTNKLYLIALGVLLLLAASAVELLLTKKLVWKKFSFDNLLILFLVSTAVSIIISSPNKIQAIVNVGFGLLTIVSLTLFYFYLSRSKIHLSHIAYQLSAVIVSLLTVVFFFQPFKNINLPASWQFLKTAAFTPLGGRVELVIFLGFFTLYNLSLLLKQSDSQKKSTSLFLIAFVIGAVGLFFGVYTLVKPTPIQLPPLRLSWFAAVEVLKNPLTAAFGVGVDNFTTIFTKVKDLAYNQSLLWQIGSFTASRSTILHILTETGFLGLLTFGLLLFSLVRTAMKQSNDVTLKTVVGYLVFVVFFFPPTLVTWFLLFAVLAEAARITDSDEQSFDLSGLTPIYLSMGIATIILTAAAGYFLGRSYAGEVYFKKGIDGYVKNDANAVYLNQRQAVITNPYIERYRTAFSQTNMLIANNIAGKAGAQPTDKTKAPAQLSEQDRQTITQAIQTAIAEAKAAVALNSQKSGNWENLANIYRNVINVAQGADVWTISSYLRAIAADPQNPGLRLSLGGVYYSVGNWEEANRFFEQAVGLKPNWPNAYYNLAWANYQRKNFQMAVNAMENALRLIDPVNNKADYDKAKSELEEFKKKLPQEEQQTSAETGQPSQLTLPTPAPTIQPKIELPEQASPEAK